MDSETTKATLLAYGMIAGAAFVIERAHAMSAVGETGQRIDEAAARIWRAFRGDESLVDLDSLMERFERAPMEHGERMVCGYIVTQMRDGRPAPVPPAVAFSWRGGADG